MKKIVLAFLLLSLAGCSTFKKPEPQFTCPATGLVKGAAKVNIDGIDVRITGMQGECSEDKSTNEIVVQLTTAFTAKSILPMTQELKLPYFIGVLSPTEEILNRQAFTAVIDLKNVTEGKLAEETVIRLPIANPMQADQYKIAIGFSNVTPPASDKKE